MPGLWLRVIVGYRCLLLTFLFCSLGHRVGLAEPEVNQASRRTTKVPPVQVFRRFGYDMGLPVNHVTSIAQDSRGIMWLGTAEGLVRFDGQRTVVFPTDGADPPEVPGSFVTAVAVDDRGLVWVGTLDSGLAVYDPQSDSFSTIGKGKNSISSNRIASLTAASNGGVYVAYVGGGLDFLEGPTAAPREALTGSARDYVVGAVLEVKAGKALLVGTDVGLFQVDADGEAAHPFEDIPGTDPLRELQITAALESAEEVWVGTVEGLFRVDTAGRSTIRYGAYESDAYRLSDDRINTLIEEEPGVVWAGTENGLNRISEESLFQYPAIQINPQSLSYPNVTSSLRDSAGLLWFGTQGGPVTIYDPRAASFGRLLSDYDAPGISGAGAFALDGKNALWIGQVGPVMHIDLESFELTFYEGVLSDANAWVMTMLRNERGLWMGGVHTGLVMLDPETTQVTTYRAPDQMDGTGPGSDNVLGVVQDARGRLLLATYGGGLNLFDPESGLFAYLEPGPDRDIPTDLLYTIYPSPRSADIFWVGTEREGILRLDGNTLQVKQVYRPSAEDQKQRRSSVVSIAETASGSLWFGTYGGGLGRLEPGAEKPTFYSHGFPNHTIWGVLEDSDGRVWMSTNGGGLLMFEPQTERLTVFDEADGIQAKEYSQNCYADLGDGRFVFGGSSGINVFRPTEITVDSYSPPPILTGFKLLNEAHDLGTPIWRDPEIKVDYFDAVLTFLFASPSYTAPQRTQFLYRLVGAHDWLATPRGEITYAHLAPGEYSLEIKALNRHGVPSEKPTRISFVISPPPWKTWWAYTIYAGLIALAIGAYVRYQRRKVTELRRANRLEAVERELALSAAVQEGFLPEQDSVSANNYNVFGFYRPADVCSGDWWWYEPKDNGGCTLLVGDVTGHGAGSAMVTAAAAAAFRSGSLRTDPLEERLKILSEEVRKAGGGSYHMTLAAVEVEGATGEYRLYGLGGPPPMLQTGAKRPRVIPLRGVPLGSPGVSIGRAQGRLNPGDRFILYTDGVTEIDTHEERQLGLRGFAKLVQTTWGMDGRATLDRVRGQLEQYLGDRFQDDDWTMCLVEWRGHSEGA